MHRTTVSDRSSGFHPFISTPLIAPITKPGVTDGLAASRLRPHCLDQDFPDCGLGQLQIAAAGSILQYGIVIVAWGSGPDSVVPRSQAE